MATQTLILRSFTNVVSTAVQSHLLVLDEKKSSREQVVLSTMVLIKTFLQIKVDGGSLQIQSGLKGTVEGFSNTVQQVIFK